MNNREMDAAQMKLHEALKATAGGDGDFLTSTTILSMSLAYVLYGKQEIERLAEANPEVDPNDPDPYKQIFDSIVKSMAAEFAPKDGPELDDAIRESAAHYIKAYFDDPPEERGQPLVDILTRFYEGEGAGQFKITIEPSRVPERLMTARYIPMLNAELINILFNFDLEGLTENPETHVATLKRDGAEIQVEGYDAIKSLSTSPLKLLDIILAYLTFDNFFDAEEERAPESIRTVVEIPLHEYAELREVSIEPRKLDDPDTQERENRNAASRKSRFIAEIERELDTWARFRVAGKITKGPRAGEYVKLVIIGPNHSVVNDYIRVTVPVETAQYLLETRLLMEYAPQLQRLKDSNPNTYRIGRRLLLHNSMYSNKNRKNPTANTLRVASIIASTPFIPTWETLEARGSRNWKQKIKNPVETVFQHLEENGVLISWQYRDARTKKTLTPKQAEYITPVDYMNLMVDFKLIENPEGDLRRQRAIQKRSKTTK